MTITNEISASRQWASRPEDERFGSIAEYASAMHARKAACYERQLRLSRLEMVPTEGEGITLRDTVVDDGFSLSNLAISQLAQDLGVPTAIVDPSKFDADIISDVFNHRIGKIDPEKEGLLLLERDPSGNDRLRCVTSPEYRRIWDADLCKYLTTLGTMGWKVPPARPVRDGQRGTRPATQEDVLKLCTDGGGGLAVKVGDPIAPAGLYSGDRNSFTFLVDDTKRVTIPGPGDQPRDVVIGFTLTNSEVGLNGVNFKLFGMDTVCGNHIMWDCEVLMKAHLRHRGKIEDRLVLAFHNIVVDNEAFASWGKRLTRIMEWMNRKVLGTNKETVVDATHAIIANPVISKKFIGEVYENAERWRSVDGAPDTWSGMYHSFTRVSQAEPNQDKRVVIDGLASAMIRKADKQLQLA